MKLFKTKSSTKRYLEPYYHRDSPPDGRIQTPEMHLRGWFAVDPALTCRRIELKHGDNWTLPLATEQRPDVERVYPDRTVAGFDTLVPSEMIRERGSSSWELVLQCDAATYRYPLTLDVSEKLPEDGYYRSRDPLSGPGGGFLSDEQKACWQRDGFLLLPGFFDASRLDAVNAFVDELWRTRAALTEPVTIDAYIGAETVHTMGRRYLLKEAPASAREGPYKINDLFLSYPDIRDVILDEGLVSHIRALLDGDPVACNSLYFEYGSEQPDHFDTFFMPPRVRNRMLASWIALEDVTQGNGPLQYYPGSHLIEPYLFANGRYNRTPEERSRLRALHCRRVEAPADRASHAARLEGRCIHLARSPAARRRPNTGPRSQSSLSGDTLLPHRGVCRRADPSTRAGTLLPESPASGSLKNRGQGTFLKPRPVAEVLTRICICLLFSSIMPLSCAGMRAIMPSRD